MNFFYVIINYANDDIVVFPCHTKAEAKQLACTKRSIFPNADIVITKTIYSELKVKVNNLD